MEAAAVFALAGLGYIVTRLSGKEEGPAPSTEGFQETPGAPLRLALQGEAPKGPATELDFRYKNLMSEPLPPGEPNPGVRGTLLNYSPPPMRKVPMNPAAQPRPEPIDSATPDVALNPAGIEAQPNYLDGDFITSPLSGQRMATSDFRHNNMQPFYGGSVKQNVSAGANSGILDSYSGAGITQIAKKEVETMFNTATTPFGNPFGLEESAEFVRSRIVDPRARNGERPFEPTKVGPGMNEGFAATGKGGFQQFEVNQYMIDNIRRTDDLRTADNPKQTYNQPVVPGQHFIGGAAQTPGEVRKYKPDTFYIDESGERFGAAGQEGFQKETSRPVQVLKHTVRPETSSEVIGPAAAQEFGESYVIGSYRTPMAQQYGGAGYRNADMTSYTSADTDAAENDYGRSGYEVRPNERNFTSERTMGLNLKPAEAGALTVHYQDENRPTRRQETVGNLRQSGTAVGYAGGAPAVTVWDPHDVARTTVKEGTIDRNWFGQAAPADGATRLKVYDPDDVARPTQKQQLATKWNYYGTPAAANQDFTSHDAAYNMRTNPSKEQIATGRDPMHGNGGALAVFDGNIHQTTKKLDADIVNDRSNAVNRVVGLPTGVGDIGQVRPRVPLKLDVSRARNGADVISSVSSNPLMATQNLARNAQHDEELLQEMLAAM